MSLNSNLFIKLESVSNF